VACGEGGLEEVWGGGGILGEERHVVVGEKEWRTHGEVYGSNGVMCSILYVIVMER
jgi:hypothetical protein